MDMTIKAGDADIRVEESYRTRVKVGRQIVRATQITITGDGPPTDQKKLVIVLPQYGTWTVIHNDLTVFALKDDEDEDNE